MTNLWTYSSTDDSPGGLCYGFVCYDENGHGAARVADERLASEICTWANDRLFRLRAKKLGEELRLLGVETKSTSVRTLLEAMDAHLEGML